MIYAYAQQADANIAAGLLLISVGTALICRWARR